MTFFRIVDNNLKRRKKHFQDFDTKKPSAQVMSRRSPPSGRYSRSCSSNDPRDLERRIFVGNLPTSDMEKKDLEDLFSPYGKIVGQ